jgi:hypothetical protein
MLFLRTKRWVIFSAIFGTFYLTLAKTKAVEPKRGRNRSGYVKILKSSHATRPREEWIEQAFP